MGELNEKFREITFQEAIHKIAEYLEIVDPRLTQSMLICKSEKIGGEVKPHQDSTFFYTEPCKKLAFWIALEDENSGFCFVNKEGNELKLDEVMTLVGNWKEESFVYLPMKKGSLIVFDGKLVHGSKANLSDRSRNAYTFNVISGETKYSEKNWMQRREFIKLAK